MLLFYYYYFYFAYIPNPYNKVTTTKHHVTRDQELVISWTLA